jgi:hypothetical protein
MAQPFMCDNGDNTLAFTVMTQPETGDVTALCGPCLLEWAEALLDESGRLGAIVGAAVVAATEKQAAQQSKSAGSRKGKAATAAAPAQDTAPLGESTPDQRSDTPV